MHPEQLYFPTKGQKAAERKCGFKNGGRQVNRSSQRDAILSALRATKTHPTADELYASLHENMPHLSLATVYRNLEQLAKAGIIRVLNGSGARRFDGDMMPHHHKRCDVCGSILDLNFSDLAILDRNIDLLLPKIGCVSYSIEFSGTCDKCKK